MKRIIIMKINNVYCMKAKNIVEGTRHQFLALLNEFSLVSEIKNKAIRCIFQPYLLAFIFQFTQKIFHCTKEC